MRILLGHKDVEIKWYGSRSYIDKKYASVYQNMFQLVDDVCKDDNMEQLAKEVDVIFTATPQGLCASLVNDEILSKVNTRSARACATIPSWITACLCSQCIISEAELSVFLSTD